MISIHLFTKGMSLLAGHKRFEDFTIVAAKAGIADGYPGATKASAIVWAFTYFCGKRGRVQ